jgi:hypothetical protein
MRRPTSTFKPAPASSEQTPEVADAQPLDRGIRAVLALLAADREAQVNPDAALRPTAVLLTESGGLTLHEAALLTGRSYEATRGIVRRWRERSGSRPPITADRDPSVDQGTE